MDFQSPRFQGDPDLLRILNDPDTGTEKLQPGSPPNAVRALQQALFDLGWTLRIEPAFTDEAAFVVGIYGPVTTKTVLAYKTHYDIHFPPDAPTGFIDGFAGPRTLARLDAQIVPHDASVVVIEAKAEELRALGLDVMLHATPPTTLPVLGTHGVERTAWVNGELGAVLHTAELGAFEVHGAIYTDYLRHGGASGPLGFPVSDQYDEDGDTQRSDFEHGSVRYHVSTGTTEFVPPGG